jgi:hypothetical protein
MSSAALGGTAAKSLFDVQGRVTGEGGHVASFEKNDDVKVEVFGQLGEPGP